MFRVHVNMKMVRNDKKNMKPKKSKRKTIL